MKRTAPATPPPLAPAGARARLTRWLVASCLVPLGLFACSTATTVASKKHAKPWESRLRALFDDQNDLCTPWLGSEEMWAVSERQQLTHRTFQADIITVGTVRALVRADAYGESKQAALQFDAEELLRGVQADLPEGNRRLLLPVSPEQQARVTNGIIGRQAVLFLRWLPGTSPPFRWHLTCATAGVAAETKTFLEARKKGQTPP